MAGNFININVKVEKSNNNGRAGVIQKKLDSTSTSQTRDEITKNINNENVNNRKESNSGGAALAAVTTSLAIDAVKQAATTTINSAIGAAKFKATVGGNTAKANALNNTITGVTEGISTGGSILNWTATGASLGSTFGGWGTLIGTVVGLVIGTSTELYDVIAGNRAELAELKWQLQQQVLESDKKARRLGIIITNRGRNSSFEYKL